MLLVEKSGRVNILGEKMMPESRRIKSGTREGKQERKCERGEEELWYLTGGARMVVLDRGSRNAGTRQGEQECGY